MMPHFTGNTTIGTHNCDEKDEGKHSRSVLFELNNNILSNFAQNNAKATVKRALHQKKIIRQKQKIQQEVL